MENTTQPPDDLVGLAEAARILPCAIPGRKIHTATLCRWIFSGRLRGWKICGRLFVSRADLRALARPVKVKVGAIEQRKEKVAANKERERWTRDTLAAHGIKLP